MASKSGPDIIEDGLVLCLDAGSKRSYPRTGTTWTDTVGGITGSFTNGASFDSGNAGSIIPLDEWTFVSLTYDGSYRRIFLNGLLDVETADSSHTIQYDSNPILLAYGDYNLEFNGRISTAQIYNRALTATEITQNYNVTRHRFGV